MDVAPGRTALEPIQDWIMGLTPILFEGTGAAATCGRDSWQDLSYP